MTLSATQLGLCLQSYWYMWLTSGLSGLLFIGIDIGIAAFFMAKFKKRKGPARERPPSTAQNRSITPIEIDNIDYSYRQNTSRGSATRSTSALILNNSGSTEDVEDFAQATCQLVNGVRRQYDAPPVEVDDQLTAIAQDWANQMALTGKLEHRPLEYRNFGRQALGENFIAVFKKELTADRMIRKWLKEGRVYRFGHDGGRETNNFTQLVWHASREIGVGRARSADGNWWYGVVVFDPPGNIPNQYAQHVTLPRT
ncbi:unnamed protein product [Rotaria magnacalcarata]|uniref:SCP domain-containing protein n=2 Tax=Rotaria magnacalcarata TaxID=392030 RepID=A0A816BUG5_9BILA|nr:unnamed protein product [Rotaria magnacalcarata]CAF1941957.1 unnamed protein product [Rotaria magnacalcarata]CAF2064373.1 unnamed protein product [Rotaria magnacalcarata]CAF4266751.1 unnamed protein product [Rotaria magnacalcarata]CAF4381716.1 unnamed protein product [Rotaria magnacalcarata]